MPRDVPAEMRLDAMDRAKRVGFDLNELRNLLLDLGYRHTAGLVAAAEETVRIAEDDLRNLTIPKNEL